MTTQNQPQRSISSPEASPVLSSEDRFLIDLLVDGELDEGRRTSLLRRLDSVPNGWRACAVAFLENQCWSESLRPAEKVSSFSAALDRSIHSEKRIEESPSVSVSRKDADAEPYIIPLQSGRRRFGLIPSKARRSFWTATAGGFLLALTLTAGFGSLYWAVGGPLPRRDQAQIASQPAVLNPNLLNQEVLNQDILNQKASASGRLTAPIRRVTLKSSSNDLDGISVPCVESDRLDPALLTASPAGQMADRLRKDGHQVETVSEQMMFPLEDGRMLIVPVDTINVRYKEAEKEIPVYYQ